MCDIVYIINSNNNFFNKGLSFLKKISYINGINKEIKNKGYEKYRKTVRFI